MESTYLKRARQLVKNQRAEWINEGMIRMKLQYEYVEGNVMAAENIVPKDSESEVLDLQTPDDETILELAKRRLAIKKNLFYQTVDYILLLFCFLLLVVSWDYGARAFICTVFSLFWGGRLLYRIFKFVKPSFKDGIMTYIKKRNDYKLESEFNRLKREYMSNH